LNDRYVCVHGHFYQPPREDPLTGEMPVEPDAAPYANFNEKIHAECYAPNAEIGNYALMSFNIGPTLASWMRRYHPAVLSQIADCDRAAVAATGHGSAMVQSYHHTILPLASARDRRTEIRWGVRSFELLYGRKPRGIWLPETAVDTATLEDCADEGLCFTILAPGQVSVEGEATGSYRLALPSGRRFETIVYDGHLGGTVSFYPVATDRAEEFTSSHILPAFGRTNGHPSMVAIATDGEVYGHHHAFKDLFLNELLGRALATHGLKRVTAEQYVMEHPAWRDAVLEERSSWGCPHRLARWSAGCSCTDGPAGWKQPLRAAFDIVAEKTDEMFEDIGSKHLRDPWEARDAYVDVVDGARTFDAWYREWRAEGSGNAEHARVLLEAQRHRLAMYASCAFYWEDVSRIEPGYGIRRGLAAASLMDREFGSSIVEVFVDSLSRSRSSRENRSAAMLHASDWIPTPAI
jgi:alpha-amylase/alpha-mannosidase (GH57 family)